MAAVAACGIAALQLLGAQLDGAAHRHTIATEVAPTNQATTDAQCLPPHSSGRQDILVVNKGYAELKNTSFNNGTIEFDITGIAFRQRADAADALYFRPSADCAVSGECIQYMPTAHRVFEWD